MEDAVEPHGPAQVTRDGPPPTPPGAARALLRAPRRRADLRAADGAMRPVKAPGPFGMASACPGANS